MLVEQYLERCLELPLCRRAMRQPPGEGNVTAWRRRLDLDNDALAAQRGSCTSELDVTDAHLYRIAVERLIDDTLDCGPGTRVQYPADASESPVCIQTSDMVCSDPTFNTDIAIIVVVVVIGGVLIYFAVSALRRTRNTEKRE